MKHLLLILVLILVVQSQDFSPTEQTIVLQPIDITPLVEERRLRIAVMDTGLSYNQVNQPFMCKDKPFVNYKTEQGFDKNGHGTNVIGLIGKTIDSSKYCITSYGIHDYQKMDTYLEMLEVVEKDKPYALNLSWASPGYSYVEFETLKRLSEDQGVIIITAAGNLAQHMTEENCDMFPSCHAFKLEKNFYVIGSTTKRYSNYGTIVDEYIPSDDVGFPKRKGTSQAAAIFTGRLFSK